MASGVGLPLVSVERAVELVLEAAGGMKMGGESVELLAAKGRVLAETIRATHDSPPFDNSAMDGFAVRVGDLEGATREAPVALAVQGEVAAGDGRERALEGGRAMRINTGAPLPKGAEAVARIEDVEIDGDCVRFFAPIEAGASVRRAGEDYRKGQALLAPGGRIDARTIGLLASLGRASVGVARRPRAALLASGDELVEPGSPLESGQIYNSNRYALQAMLEGFGAEVFDLGCVGDSAEATRRAVEKGFGFDLLVTTGGVSMGSRDYIRPALIEAGAEEIFWKVKQRPGKPLFFARKGGTLCFGLPGNPVSVFVTATIYVRGALLAMQGARDVELPWRRAVAGEAFEKRAGLSLFARAEFVEGGDRASPPRIKPSAGQGSHQFSAVAGSAGLARFGEASAGAAPGSDVEFLEFSRIF
jgi:molybdopterin molybdotransferase